MTSPDVTRPPLTPYAVSGLLAAATGTAVGHLVAAFVAPSASPVVAIGGRVIDATPTPVKDWAVSTFGTADKVVLVASIVLVTLGFEAVGRIADCQAAAGQRDRCRRGEPGGLPLGDMRPAGR